MYIYYFRTTGWKKCIYHIKWITFLYTNFIVRKYIKKLLKNNTVVLCDRYAYSGVAYSSAKGLDIEWCKKSDNGLPKPDVVIYIDASLQKINSRKNYGNEKYENNNFQSKVKSVFDNSLYDQDYWKTIDGDKSIENISKEIYNHISKLYKNFKTDKKLMKLW